MAAPDHLFTANEETRLQALHTADVQAALEEPIFQQLVDLAARVFNLPISFLSVVDRAHVDFSLTHGIPTLAGVPREQTLCALPVRQESTFVINAVSSSEASVHRQTADKLGLEFYAGTPLMLKREFAIGALCVSDTTSREFSDQEQHILEMMATLISQAFLARQFYLQQPDGQKWWQTMQQVAAQEINSLEALMRYLASRNGAHLPTADSVLGTVQRRLADIAEILLGSVPK